MIQVIKEDYKQDKILVNYNNYKGFDYAYIYMYNYLNKLKEVLVMLNNDL